jgi:excisionase family DNA binding protein
MQPVPTKTVVRFVGIREAAARLKVSVPTLRRWDQRGRLRAVRNPQTGERLYRAEELDAWRQPQKGAIVSPPVVAPVNELIGRSQELARLLAYVKGGARHVTIVGAGGMGKTALAQAFLEQLEGDSIGRKAFCDLSEARGTDALARVASVLAIELPSPFGGSDAVAFVGQRLGRLGRAVVVLDNVEHVVPEVVALLQAWREPAKGMTFVMTSRERLRLRDEQVLPLSPLSTPMAGETNRARILEREAVQMILACAERQGSPIEASVHAMTLGHIARKLDGVPLAIELAAVRLTMFGPDELLERLSAPLDILASSERDRPARHATIRATIAWSYDLLNAEERALLRRLSVFRGGFTIEAARYAGEPSRASKRPSERILESLIDKSLVHHREKEGRTLPRLAMYESIREFAMEKLDADPNEQLDARERHASYFAGRAELAMVAPPTDVELEPLAADRDNILAALEASEAGEPRAWALAVAADYAFGATVPIADRIGWLDRALAETRAGTRRTRAERVLLARAYATRGRLRIEQTASALGMRDLRLALMLTRRARHRELEESLLGHLATALTFRGSVAAVRRSLRDAERAAGSGRVHPGRSMAWASAGSVHHELGELVAAERCFQRAVGAAKTMNQPVFEARFLARLGRVYSDRGRLLDAEDALARSLSLLKGDRFEGMATAHQALLRWRQWRLDEARQAYERAVSLFAARGAVGFEMLHRLMLAAVLAGLGRGIDSTSEIERVCQADRGLGGDGFDAEIHLAKAHGALLELRRATGEGRGDPGKDAATLVRATLARRRKKIARDKDTRALAERLSATLLRQDLPSSPPLVVAADGRWLTGPPGTRVDLPLGSPLGLLLRALVHARQQSPGRALSRDELVAAAWPDERILVRAAAHRVYAAVSELRAAGLGDAGLERVGHAYRLSPSLPLLVEEGDQR